MDFDLKKYLAEGRLFKEADEFEKNVWFKLTDEEKEEFADEIFNLIDTAYSPIGGNPNYKSASDVVGKEKGANYMVIDLDDDPELDALKVSKDKPAGNKSVGMGHDGSKPARSAAVNITAIMLKEPGQYIEVSGKLKDILIAKGVPVVTDKETIQQVMKGKDITMNDDGTYSREISGEMYTKTLMGNPIV
tara:strand:- start:599 stop:1168 length:570 start_codon:yes stop_codon:yes gene_type:complete